MIVENILTLDTLLKDLHLGFRWREAELLKFSSTGLSNMGRDLVLGEREFDVKRTVKYVSNHNTMEVCSQRTHILTSEGCNVTSSYSIRHQPRVTNERR